MIMSVKLDSRGKVNATQECAGCGKKIHDRFVLKALDMYWHEDCLKCGCCDCRLGEVGHSLYTKGNLLLCKRDYLRLFGSTGYCAACNKVIPAFEMVMRARTNVYHLECFACQQCGHRFCVGDHFYLYENKILCGPDYEERMVFANLSSNPNQLAHLKSQGRSMPAAYHGSPYPPHHQGGGPLPPTAPLCHPTNNNVKEMTPLPPISSVRNPRVLHA